MATPQLVATLPACAVVADGHAFVHLPRLVTSPLAYPCTPDNYFTFPSAPYCARNAHRSLTSFSFLMPANAILVPGIFAFGSLMYSLNRASLQVMPEFLLASE